MNHCRRCLELEQKETKSSVYCTVMGMLNRHIMDCYLCDECLKYMKKNNALIKIFDPNEKPITFPVRD